MNEEIQRPRLRELDGLRGIAALAVMSTHVVYLAAFATGRDTFPGLLPAFFTSFSHLAVLVFFVISGFVVGYTVTKPLSTASLLDYLKKRLIRLYPIYLLALVLGFAATEGRWSGRDVLGHAAFMHVWLVPVVAGNDSLWSLHYEVLFYILFVVPWCLRLDPLKVAVALAPLALAAVFLTFHPLKVLGYFSIWSLGLWLSRLPMSSTNDAAQRRFPWLTIVFACAAYQHANVLAVVVRKHGVPLEGSLPPVLCDVVASWAVIGVVAATAGRRIPSGVLPGLFAVVAAVVAVLVFAIYRGLLEAQPRYEIAGLCLGLAAASLLVRGAPLKVLARLAWLGDLSYALYVVHRPVLILTYRALPPEPSQGLVVSASVIGIGLSLALAYLMERQFQPRIARLLRKWLRVRPPVDALAAT